MWNIYLGPSSASVFKASDGTLQYEAGGTLDAVVLESLRWASTMRKWRTPRVSIWLSGALARPFIVGPIAGLRTWSEAKACALAAAPTAVGISTPTHPVLSGWPESASTLAITADEQLIGLVRRSAASCKVHVATVRPWWGLACDIVSRKRDRSTCGFIADEDDALTVLSTFNGRWTGAATCSPKPNETSIQALKLRLFAGHLPDEARLATAALINAPDGQRWPCIRWQNEAWK